MRLLALCGLVVLGGCGDGTTGTNYSDPPPMAEIVATPTPIAAPDPEENAGEAAVAASNDTAAPAPVEGDNVAAPAE